MRKEVYNEYNIRYLDGCSLFDYERTKEKLCGDFGLRWQRIC